ncbi:MAG: GC-type dockerin domain-anchored protein [Phycisphaerales bacterium JB040]
MRANIPSAVLSALVLSVAVESASAQPYEITWYTIDGGGGTSSGGTYSLSGTIGQPDAAPPISGGTYTVEPGFWPGVLLAPPCQADVNNDGVLDNGDIGAFVTLFLAGDMAADFTNDGILDNGDIGAFVGAFLAGCP